MGFFSRERESTSDDFVGAFDSVRIEVLFARFGLGHEWVGFEGLSFSQLKMETVCVFGVVEVKVSLAKNVMEMDGTVVEVEGFLWGF